MSTLTEPLRHHVGLKIRQARLEAGLSHDGLAKALGTWPNGRINLIRLEQGKHLPRPETLEAIADATGKDIEWFLPHAERIAAGKAAA